MYRSMNLKGFVLILAVMLVIFLVFHLTMKSAVDEKTEKEKRTNCCYLVQAGSFNSAVKAIDDVMGGTMIDYVIASVSETNIMDVFEYQKKEKDDKPEYEQ